MKNFYDLQSYLKFLDRIDLKTIESEVDPELEITEICSRTIEEKNGQALLFKNVKGSKYPLAANLFGTEERMNLSLGCNPKELGEEILNFAQKQCRQNLIAFLNFYLYKKRTKF